MNKITLDKERTLKLKMKSLFAANTFLKKAGYAVTAMELFQKIPASTAKSDPKNPMIDFGILDFQDITILLWCCLIHEDESLTVDGLINIIDEMEKPGNVINFLGSIVEAFADFLPDAPKQASGAQKKTVAMPRSQLSKKK